MANFKIWDPLTGVRDDDFPSCSDWYGAAEEYAENDTNENGASYFGKGRVLHVDDGTKMVRVLVVARKSVTFESRDAKKDKP